MWKFVGRFDEKNYSGHRQLFSTFPKKFFKKFKIFFKSGFAWVCMGLYGFAWVCMGLHGFAWVCMKKI